MKSLIYAIFFSYILFKLFINVITFTVKYNVYTCLSKIQKQYIKREYIL